MKTQKSKLKTTALQNLRPEKMREIFQKEDGV